MNLKDLKYGKIKNFELTVEVADKKLLSEIRPKKVCTIFEDLGNAFLGLGKQTFPVKCTDKKYIKILTEAIQDRKRALFWLTARQDEKIQLQSHTFNAVVSLGVTSLEIGLTDIIEADIKKRFLTNSPLKKDILGWLQDQLVIQLEKEETALVVSAGNTGGIKDAFRIHGERINVDIKKNKDGLLELTRILHSNSKHKNPLSLIKDKVAIKDITTVGKIRAGVQEQLNQIIKSGESYIKLWEEYNQLEIERSHKQAKDIGHVSYNKVKYLEEEVAYELTIISENFDEWVLKLKENRLPSLATGDELPVFFKGIPTEEATTNEFYSGEIVSWNKKSKTIKLKSIDPESTKKPKKSGFIWLSLLGDNIRTKRRTKAADRIRTGQLPMPQLSLILENKEVPTVQYRQLKPMTAKVLKSFGHSPNPMQEEALSIALNTPDIAVIQGPPGTGKTQVIKALCTRLVEEANKNGETISETILLTAFQHDAVSNMVGRVRLLGLPVTKIAPKAGESDPIEKWTIETIQDLTAETAKLPDAPNTVYRKEIAKFYVEFRRNKNISRQAIGQRLNAIFAQHNNAFSTELQVKYIDLLGNNATVLPENSDRELLLIAIHGLRTALIPYQDDGIIKIMKLQKRLATIGLELEKEAVDLLDKLVDTENPSAEALAKLEMLKNDLLDRFIQNPLDKEPLVQRDKVSDLLQATIAEFKKLELKGSSVKNVLEEYMDDLKNHPKRLEKSLKSYQVALAATVQQSDGKKLYDQLDSDHEAFQSVIVDEAARANPLDLFIALTRGKRRIILVGDQRQLPHMLEPTIEQKLAEKYKEVKELNYQEAIQKSLFERFVLHLKGQNGKRTIMLNTQYRMHPVIGDFVSRVFYERFGDAQIQNGLEAKERKHAFKQFENKAVAWIEASSSLGKEENNGSYYRQGEAKIIMSYLDKMMKEAPKMSFGLISFYAAQVSQLKKAGLRYGFTEEKEGHIGIKSNYKYVEDKNGEQVERLRIGSVDSFQGKEFDVVILSMTRSNTHKASNPRRKYGFLTLENRLNVAMSRAKRLLIVVGDSKMLTCANAADAVFGLTEFYQLTGTKDGIRL